MEAGLPAADLNGTLRRGTAWRCRQQALRATHRHVCRTLRMAAAAATHHTHAASTFRTDASTSQPRPPSPRANVGLPGSVIANSTSMPHSASPPPAGFASPCTPQSGRVAYSGLGGRVYEFTERVQAFIRELDILEASCKEYATRSHQQCVVLSRNAEERESRVQALERRLTALEGNFGKLVGQDAQIVRMSQDIDGLSTDMTLRLPISSPSTWV